MTRPLSPEAARGIAPAGTIPISRAEAIASAGATLAAAREEMHETYLREGAMGVARRACPGGSDEELERLARKYEGWRQEAAERRRGAA